MRVLRKSRTQFVAAVVAVAGFAAWIAGGSPAAAQCEGGDFILQQHGGTVGWVYANGDRSVEWWAYISDVYEWADSGSTSTNPWRLDAEYTGAGTGSSTYAEWKIDVLGRSAAQGHTILFQRHTVTEESVVN